jgi:hypothetical protein
MSASTVHCYVLGDNVSVVSDLNGKVTNVVCPMYVRLTRGCLKKVEEDPSTLAVIIKKGIDHLTGSRTNYCEFVDLK